MNAFRPHMRTLHPAKRLGESMGNSIIGLHSFLLILEMNMEFY